MSVNRVLAGAALVLGLLAPFVPARDPDAGRLPVVELAQWLRDRRAVRVVDLRDAEAFAAFNLPRAVSLTPAAARTLPLSAGDTVVFYDDGSGAARAAWAAHRDGPAAVWWLADGVTEWVDEIMNPTIAPDAAPAERAAFDRVAELSRYFGGMPRIARPAADTASGATRFERTVRRGCAF